ncbi:MAG TPA: hypothetical protein VFB26_01200 [Gaiellaceae bacterium]|nr:hypothetical protein [Gaiellaceae bacterium]
MSTPASELRHGRIVQAGDDDRGRVRAQLLDRPEQLQAGAVVQLDVRDDERDVDPSQQLLRLAHAVRGDPRIPGGREDAAEHRAHDRVVLDDEQRAAVAVAEQRPAVPGVRVARVDEAGEGHGGRSETAAASAVCPRSSPRRSLPAALARMLAVAS